MEYGYYIIDSNEESFRGEIRDGDEVVYVVEPGSPYFGTFDPNDITSTETTLSMAGILDDCERLLPPEDYKAVLEQRAMRSEEAKNSEPQEEDGFLMGVDF